MTADSQDSLDIQGEGSDSLLSHPRVHDLLEQGAREGRVTYGLINDVLGDLQIDEVDAEELFEALENRGIEIVEDDAPVRAPSTSAGYRCRAPTPRLNRHRDLDEVLASIEGVLRLFDFAGCSRR
jgi:hypothetical protein